MPPSSYLSLNTSVPTSTLSFWCSQVSNLRRMKRCWEEECLGQWCFSLSPAHCSPHCDANRPPSKSCSPSSLPARSHRPRQWCRALCPKGSVGVAKNHFFGPFSFWWIMLWSWWHVDIWLVSLVWFPPFPFLVESRIQNAEYSVSPPTVFYEDCSSACFLCWIISFDLKAELLSVVDGGCARRLLKEFYEFTHVWGWGSTWG